MKHLMIAALVLVPLSGCMSERRLKFNDCMKSGSKDLYGSELAPKFCNCMADGFLEGVAPFELGNKCSKPIVEKMSLENKKP